eukprot:CAMPEP_0172367116 /NCGR_PEP_ID=MMETSP1060-20121228/19300_1 /TAXON_ID=37318 /ORGANISM="Pseudo-nitzschia pungens, Strain cf. cingulata" /LENGTH=441 /DNA_ID=CAMNT_0013091241 /DNA_START=102 /DNA_END=1427 /DNA_ORIENTATION=-
MKVGTGYTPMDTLTVLFLVAITTTLVKKCVGFVVSPDEIVMCGSFRGDRNGEKSKTFGIANLCSSPSPPGFALGSRLPPSVWIEDAEEGFVDEDENLEPGEVCLKSVKSFASGVVSDRAVDIRLIREVGDGFRGNERDDETVEKRFLSAGALVQRPSYSYSDKEERADGQWNDAGNTSEEDSSSLAAAAPTAPPPTATATAPTTTTAFICDAWMADSILSEGGPNLQLQGALQVLDDLFLFHLQREQQQQMQQMQMLETQNQQHNEPENDEKATSRDASEKKTFPDPTSFGVRALRNFVVHCGDDDDDYNNDDDDDVDDALGGIDARRSYRSEQYVAASRMAARMRGFAPLREMVKVDSIYHSQYYDHDLSGMVPDCRVLPDLYRRAARESSDGSDSDGNGNGAATHHKAKLICELLPDDETIARHTTKRFSIGRRPSSLP